MPRPFLIIAAVIATASATAAEKPLSKPSQDVEVEYRASGMAQSGMTGGDGSLKMYFANKGTRMRIEPPNGLGYMLMNTDGGPMTVVMPMQQIYVDMPPGPGMSPMLDAEGATFIRKGTDTVAGMKCTVYDMTNANRASTVCLTDDGVLLRGRGGDGKSSQTMEAVRVTYGVQPPALFMPPSNFQKMTMPRR